ncbi:unnamed protein product [Brassicogethes aeneus]|uniref:Poly(A)-specific ribonuclease PARN n=1 Tax=Brassicogethes aeneus TaxID=1431903 RepID=A0A9P0FR17_BRAAE|nr:unnamed protein product [Brassicogethes aeneus]
MDVTKSNFNEVLPKIKESIKNSSFMSIDCELTGLNVARNINAFDTPAEYYNKVRVNSRDFLVIQYGLSIFRYDSECDTFKHQSYNFYIFRKPYDKNIPDQRFLCQTSSIDFLITQGFDFNKLFKEGISYLNSVEEEKWKINLEEKRKNSAVLRLNPNRDSIPIPDNLENFINDVVKILDNFLESNDTEVQLPRCNAFARRLVYQTAAEKFGDRLNVETRQMDKDRVLFAYKMRTKEEEEEIERKKYEEALEAFDSYVGFSKVLKMVRESGKLIIGHNLCLDILHTIDKFITPLPEDYQEFKQLTSAIFPMIVDTKYMSSSEKIKDLIPSTVLKNVLDTVSATPFEMPAHEIEEGAESYQINDYKEHEAGYDAFITALSFASMWKYLGKLENKSPAETFGDHRLLNKVINRIFLMNLADNQYINLQGNDLNPSRDHVFHLTFPKEWKFHNITELFSPFGSVYISWIDETSAYVSLNKKEQSGVALNTLSQSDTYSIMTYRARRAMLESKTNVAPVTGQRRKMSENISDIAEKRQKVEDNTEHDDSKWETVTKKGKRKGKTFKESTWDQ